MNPWLALALGTVAVIAAGALWFTGNVVAAALALVVSVAFDVLFVVAMRNVQSPQRK